MLYEDNNKGIKYLESTKSFKEIKKEIKQMNEENTEKSVKKQNDKPWLFQKGVSGNPKGKPKGTFSLKTYAKKYLEKMTDEEKLEFMEGLPKEVIWKMAEGNPQTNTDLTTGGEKINVDEASKEKSNKAINIYLDGRDKENTE